MEGPSSDPGVNTRALTELFELVGASSSSSSRQTAGWTYQVRLSVVEIYNESLRDLLLERSKGVGVGVGGKLEVRQGSDGQVHVPDLTEVEVSSVTQVQHLISTRVKPNRSVAATNMNEHSSRSHCCVFVRVIGTNAGHNGVGAGEKTNGRLVLIDLAGSERISRSQVTGDALVRVLMSNPPCAHACDGHVIDQQMS